MPAPPPPPGFFLAPSSGSKAPPPPPGFMPIVEPEEPSYLDRFISRTPLVGITQVPAAIRDIAAGPGSPFGQVAQGLGSVINDLANPVANYNRLRERGQSVPYSAMGAIPVVGPAADVVTQDIYQGRVPEVLGDLASLALGAAIATKAPILGETVRVPEAVKSAATTGAKVAKEMVPAIAGAAIEHAVTGGMGGGTTGAVLGQIAKGAYRKVTGAAETAEKVAIKDSIAAARIEVKILEASQKAAADAQADLAAATARADKAEGLQKARAEAEARAAQAKADAADRRVAEAKARADAAAQAKADAEEAAQIKREFRQGRQEAAKSGKNATPATPTTPQEAPVPAPPNPAARPRPDLSDPAQFNAVLDTVKAKGKTPIPDEKLDSVERLANQLTHQSRSASGNRPYTPEEVSAQLQKTFPKYDPAHLEQVAARVRGTTPPTMPLERFADVMAQDRVPVGEIAAQIKQMYRVSTKEANRAATAAVRSIPKR